MIFQVQHISAFLENNPNNFLYVVKVQNVKLSNDIYIYFVLEKETEKSVISKKHEETLCSAHKKNYLQSFKLGKWAVVWIQVPIFYNFSKNILSIIIGKSMEIILTCK